MKRLISLCASLCVMALIFSGPVRAQQQLFVANWGNDGASCSQSTPCLTFQGAINKGNVAQINCLTSGSYGSVTVAASITIDCGTGNVGAIFPGNTSVGIYITAVSATVVLRHLSLSGIGFGNGIYAPVSGTLIMEDCSIQGFGYGIYYAPTGGRGLLQVSNSQVVNNGTGIRVSPFDNNIASLALNRLELVGNSNIGLIMTGPGVVAGTIHDSLIASSAVGVWADASQVYLAIDGSNIAANLQSGVYTNNASDVIGIGTSTFSGNAVAVKSDAGSLVSFGNNQLIANGSNGNFTGSVPLR